MDFLKNAIACFSMVLVTILIGVMLWDKASKKRVEEFKVISDYIVDSNYKHQKEWEEIKFIKLMASLEYRINNNDAAESIKYELQNAKGVAYSLAPYGTELDFQRKINLVDCLVDLYNDVNHKKCVEQYAITTTQKVKL